MSTVLAALLLVVVLEVPSGARAAPPPNAGYVGASAVNLRAAPKKDAAVLMKLPFATPLVVGEEHGGFYAVEIPSTPPHKGFVGAAVVRRGALKKTADDDVALRRLREPSIVVDDTGDFIACAGAADRDACTRDAEARLRNESRDGFERAATFGPDVDAARLQVWRSFTAWDSDYAKTPTEVLALSPWLSLAPVEAYAVGADVEREAGDVASQVERCAPTPAAKKKGPFAPTALVAAVSPWADRSGALDLMFATSPAISDVDELKKLRAAARRRVVAVPSADRALVATTDATAWLFTATLPGPTKTVVAPKMRRDGLAALGPAPSSVRAADGDRGVHVVVYGATPALAKRGRAPFARDVAVSTTEACSGVTATVYDADGDGEADLVVRSFKNDGEGGDWITYRDALLRADGAWVRRLLAWGVENDV